MKPDRLVLWHRKGFRLFCPSIRDLLFCGSQGTRELRVPRARVRDEETGETTEFRSELLPRYARRTREVDEAILGTYLSGANSRRVRKALKPLLGEAHLSKSVVSRVVSRLKERFEEWQNRNLGHDPRPSELFPPLAVVPLPRNQPSVPSQQGFRCDDTGDFRQEFPAKRLTLYRQPTSLVVCEAKLPPAEPSLEDSVLLE